jgi:hypothetical protein
VDAPFAFPYHFNVPPTGVVRRLRGRATDYRPGWPLFKANYPTAQRKAAMGRSSRGKTAILGGFAPRAAVLRNSPKFARPLILPGEFDAKTQGRSGADKLSVCLIGPMGSKSTRHLPGRCSLDSGEVY